MGIKKSIKQSVKAKSIQEAFEEFIAEKEAQNLSKVSIAGYSQSFNYWYNFNEFNKDHSISDVDNSSVIEFIKSLQDKGNAATGINHYVRGVRAFLYWSAEKGYIEKFHITLLKQQEVAPKHFADTDIKKLLVKPNKKDSFIEWRTWAFVNWEMGTGNREATVCEVRLGDIDFTNREITLRHTKNKKYQHIPLSTALCNALKEYIRLWRADTTEDGYLFPNCADEGLTTGALRLSFKRYAENRGVNQFNIHGLRHTYARYYILNGGNVVNLQHILGHSSIEQTRKYITLYGQDLQNGFDDFSPLDNLLKSNHQHNVKRCI